MDIKTSLVAASAAALLIAGLAGCTASTPAEPGAAGGDPVVPAAPTEDTGDTGTWTQDPYLADVVAGNRSMTATLVQQWEGEDCTVQAAVDGGTMCSTYISSGGLAIESYDAILTDYRAGAGGDLDAVHAAVESAYPAARQWVDEECNWETTEECAATGQSIVDGVYALEKALAAWEAGR